MIAPKQVTQALVDERNALQVYFDALLRDVPEVVVEEPPVAPAKVITPPAPAITQVVAPITTPPPVIEPAKAAVPEWAEGNFPAMLFKVAGLTLAVPLIELSGVLVWGAQKVTPLPGHVPWFLGLTLYRGSNVPVIDTARFVLPSDRLSRLTAAPDERVTRVVFIGDGRWGLACDEVAEVIRLEPSQVRWRTQRTTRAWLAGTVIDHMCALIDPSAFARMLATGVEEAGLEIPEDSSQE